MKRFFAAAVMFFAMMGFSFAQDVKDVEDSMKKAFPKVGIDSFRESPVKGLYEVSAGSQVFYFHPDGYLVFGEIWSKEGKDLTALRAEGRPVAH